MSKTIVGGFGKGKKMGAGTYVRVGPGKWELVKAQRYSLTESPDYSAGPITMYSEFRKQDAPKDLKWHRHDKNGYVQVANERERVDYHERAKGAGIPLEWTR